MKILAIGFNHRTSPIEMREKFHLSPVEKELLIAQFRTDPSVMSAVILSTCNRCEMYVNVVDDCSPGHIVKALFTLKHQPLDEQYLKMFYMLEGPAAVQHFLEVACGLDSLILGEKQILGQIKEAVGVSREKGLMDKALNILTNYVLETGKKARQDTDIDFGGMSVSAAAVSTAQSLLGSLQDKSVLVVGSGKMGALALNYLHQKKARQIYLMNRTLENAAAVAEEVKAEVVPFWNMKATLSEVDVCICSSGAPHYLITRDLMENVAASRQSPIILIDISMPRNIDPGVADINGVTMIGLDDLDKVIERTMQKRQEAVKEVSELVIRKQQEFYNAMAKIEAMAGKQVLI